MAETHRINGRVVDQNGAPVADAHISLGDVPGLPEIALAVDAEGRFAIDLPCIALSLTAHARDGRRAEVAIGPAASEAVFIMAVP